MTQANEKAPLHWRKVLKRTNDQLLFAEDLGPVGTKVDVDIVDSAIEKVKNEDGLTEMPVLQFAGAKKRLALNRTNCKSLEKICDTPDIHSWRGLITLVVVRTKVGPDEVDAIRIAPKRPEPKKKQAPKQETTDA